MNEEKQYVRLDEHGAMRIGNSRVMLDSIGAITYYLAHTDEVHVYLKRQDELWEAWRAKSATRSSPVVERLRALRASEASKRS